MIQGSSHGACLYVFNNMLVAIIYIYIAPAQEYSDHAQARRLSARPLHSETVDLSILYIYVICLYIIILNIK